jgi:NO-binding membrane sensor protein with MHYT domain
MWLPIASVAYGLGIASIVYLVPASLAISGEAPVGFFNCISTGFSLFLIILLIDVGLSCSFCPLC